MSANPETGVDTTGTFSALPNKPTEPPTETTDQTAEPTAQQTQATDPTEANEPSDGNSETSRRFNAKLNDQEIEFEVLSDIDADSLSFLKDGIMMKNAFYRKTEELASERKNFESTKAEFDNALGQLKNQLEYDLTELNTPEMQELRQRNDPLYWEKFGQLQERKTQIDKFSELRDNQLKDKQREIIEAEAKRYSTVIPEWLDENVKQEELGKIGAMLIDRGFKPEQIQNIYDANLISILRDAMKYSEVTSKPIQPTNKPQKRLKSGTTNTDKQPEKKTPEQIFYGG